MCGGVNMAGDRLKKQQNGLPKHIGRKILKKKW